MYLFDREHEAGKRHLEGTHRTRSPAATLESFMPRMRALGITRLADVTGLDIIGVPVYMAVRPNSRSLSVSQGKGVDRDSAKASALMESIESWHAERVQTPLRYESYNELRRSVPVVDITRIVSHVGAELRLNVPMVWTEGYDLLQRRSTWVPFDCVTTNYVRPVHGRTPFRPSSNGLASGNHLLEAVVHALCELIERDAWAIWLAAGGHALKDTLVDLDTISSPLVQGVLQALDVAGVRAAVWDATSDAAIPTFVCNIFDGCERVRWTLNGVFGGGGCHLDPEVALLRALTEAIQSRLTSIAGSRDDMFHYETLANPADVRLATEAASDLTSARAFRAEQSLATDSFLGDVEVLLGALQAIGIENVAVVDVSRPEIGIPVVKAVVPGLEEDLDGLSASGPRARAASACRAEGVTPR